MCIISRKQKGGSSRFLKLAKPTFRLFRWHTSGMLYFMGGFYSRGINPVLGDVIPLG